MVCVGVVRGLCVCVCVVGEEEEKERMNNVVFIK